MTTYVYRDGRMVNKETGAPMVESPGPVACPQIMSFEAYPCPITGKEIRTLEQHNENLRRHNCVEAKELGPSATNGEIRNERFAKKHGMAVSERYRDEPWKPVQRQDNERA